MKDNLLPCPFCNSAAELDFSDQDKEDGIKPFVKCTDDACHAFGPNGIDPADAVDQWNRRHAPCPPLAAMKKQAQYSKFIAEISGNKVHIAYENGFLDAIRQLAKIINDPDFQSTSESNAPR